MMKKVLGFIGILACTILMAIVFKGNIGIFAMQDDVYLNYAEKTGYVGGGFSLNLRGAPDSKVTWESTDPDIASVSLDGYVSCLNVGEAVIMATYKNEEFYCNVTVIKPYISESEKNCEVGDKFYIVLNGTKVESYMVGDETVIKVNKKGKVTAKRAGKTKLTIMGMDGKKYTCKIYVYDTKRRDDPITTVSESSKSTANIKAEDVPSKTYTPKPGILVNFTTILYTKGTPEGLVFLKKSKVTKRLSYRDSDCRLQAEVIKPLSKMIDDAYAEGKYTYGIISGGGYREYATQDRYWQRRQGMYPGYGDDPYNNGGVICVPAVSSEHRTGFAIDFECSREAFDWLEENSYKYGFIHRYTGDKTGYTGVMDEDLHYTYVGKDIAATCFYEGLCLEEYYEKYVYVNID